MEAQKDAGYTGGGLLLVNEHPDSEVGKAWQALSGTNNIHVAFPSTEKLATGQAHAEGQPSATGTSSSKK